MRYDNSWIHRFLQLPSHAILRWYIDVVRTDTCISEDILCQLQQRSTSDADCHGVLIFDIKPREGIKFRIKYLRFEEIVELSEFSSKNGKSQQSADSGLLFVYRPVKTNCIQPVPMFLSNGPVSSLILNKDVSEADIYTQKSRLQCINTGI